MQKYNSSTQNDILKPIENELHCEVSAFNFSQDRDIEQYAGGGSFQSQISVGGVSYNGSLTIKMNNGDAWNVDFTADPGDFTQDMLVNDIKEALGKKFITGFDIAGHRINLSTDINHRYIANCSGCELCIEKQYVDPEKIPILQKYLMGQAVKHSCKKQYTTYGNIQDDNGLPNVIGDTNVMITSCSRANY